MKFQQQPHALLMIRPKAFGFNDQTAQSNAFQQRAASANALAEFDRMVDVLESHEVSVIVIDDTETPVKPDAVFPNNWISFHEDGTLVVYPMMAENRRVERRNDIIEKIETLFEVKSIVDLSMEEQHGKFLEGTGSIVFDHGNRIAYACRSERTNESVLQLLCDRLEYTAIIFDALDLNGRPIYHTNVMMAVAEKFVLLCLDTILSDEDQEKILESFVQTGKKVISISIDQMNAFAGNAIEVKTKLHENLLLISQAAFQILLPGQINAITQYVEILPLSIPSIEKIGGGSVRCMVAGIHLPLRNLTT
jgi:hypothetical protein